MLILALFMVSALGFSNSSVRGVPAAMSVLIIMPLTWLPLHQLRQFGLLALFGVLPTARLWGVGMVTLSQAALFLLVFWGWFAGALSFAGALMMTLVAVVWLFVGNILLTALLAHGLPHGKSD